jgi:hypothetical protein
LRRGGKFDSTAKSVIRNVKAAELRVERVFSVLKCTFSTWISRMSFEIQGRWAEVILLVAKDLPSRRIQSWARE